MKTRSMLFAALAICLAAVLLPSITEAKTNYVSVYSGWISDGSTTPRNSLGVYVTASFPNESASFNVTSLHIKSSYYSGNNVRLAEGDSYDYYDAARITLLDTRVYDGIPQAYIDISSISNLSDNGGTTIYSDTPGMIAKAGDTVSFPIVIKNTDGVDHTYTLAASSTTGWPMTFAYQGSSIYQIYVPASGSKTVSLNVETPYTASLGEKVFTVYADSYSMNLRVDVTSVNESVEISTKGDSVISAIGDKVYYDITLSNLQADENSYKLSLTGLPENWYYRYVESRGSTSEIAELIVPASSGKSVVLEIIPANSAVIGEYNYTAVISTYDGVDVTRDLALKLKGETSISVSYDKLSYSSKAGESFSLKVYVTNSGSGTALTNVYPAIEAPSGWTYATSPESVTTIKAGESQVFTVTVQPPANIQASDYDVKVTMKSDQADSDTLDYRIEITTESYIPYIAGGIIIVVLIGVVIVFRKFGRR